MRRQGPALLALFVALSGTAYATGFPANAIGPKQLQRNAVNRTKLASSAVSGAKVANGSVTGADIAETTLGKVPAAGGAETAENATSAVDATGATSVPRADSASSADDSLRLAGGSPADYELRLSRSCPDGFSEFNGIGSLCSFGSLGVNQNVTSAGSQIVSDDVTVTISCHTVGATSLSFKTSLSSGPWSLAWFYADGTTVSADSVSLVGGSSQAFPFAGKRLEGQFILTRAGTVTTYKVHLVDLGTICEFQEIVLRAA